MASDIPVMDDPLGRFWDQPLDIRDAPMDDQHVLLTPYQFKDLLDYSASNPTGCYPGKCWRRQIGRNTWWLLWFGDETPDHKCPMHSRTILVVKP